MQESINRRVRSDDLGQTNSIKFDIIGTRTVAEEKTKYVAYMIRVETMDKGLDDHPATFMRRYTDFLILYNCLKRDFPELLRSIHFPQKELIRNFSVKVIVERRLGFLKLLDLIAEKSQLRHSKAMETFLQERELYHALKYIKDNNFSEAVPIIENCFWLTNKLHTDRAPLVLQNLCLLVSLSYELNIPTALNLAVLAVRRYESVSDADLLRYYAPLLKLSLELCKKYDKESSDLETHLANMKRRGFALNYDTPLLELLLKDLLLPKEAT